MMAGNPSWWSMNNGMHPQQTHQLNIPNNSSTGFGNNQYTSSTPPLPPQYHFYGGSPPLADDHHHHHPDQQQDFPRSWSQLLLGGGLVNSNNNNNSSDQRFVSPFESKKLGNWEDHVKQDAGMGQNNNLILYGESADELIQVSRPPWSQIVPTSSPTSCVTSLSSNLLNFSANSKPEKRSQHQENSSECNSATTGNVHKKPRIQNSSPQPALKVRKEKLGDRITALHQLVSPFGKTDTASVLSEAIGYIRFLQAQIEALSSPYLGNVAGGNMGQPHQHSDVEDRAKDLRTRGLCLVPVSCTQHVGNDTGADYWAPALGGGF